QQESGTGWNEMYQVFNMGHRMELYIPEAIANDIIQISNNFNIDAQVIGYCRRSSGKKVVIKSEHGTFSY
ncbi:MAG: phosphoribosylformylglycinamidine cyclo-ligase, partial [Bacteroidales bacterium]|nr:phosphoribosylformylglycinamidine cyclo-ligase [Bacteroidales bacterium]